MITEKGKRGRRGKRQKRKYTKKDGDGRVSLNQNGWKVSLLSHNLGLEHTKANQLYYQPFSMGRRWGAGKVREKNNIIVRKMDSGRSGGDFLAGLDLRLICRYIIHMNVLGMKQK